MLLALDIGNTNIVAGCIGDEGILFSERIKTDTSKTDLEYVVLFDALLDLHDVNKEEIEGVAVSSVVPQVNTVITAAVKKMFVKAPMFVGPGIKTGINIAIDDPSTAGSDLIVDAVAGLNDYGAPLIMIDMGTATTVFVIDENRNFIGGAIMPGVGATMDSLVNKTSQLPRISLDAPKKVIGRNTVDSMKSGIILGQVSALDGMVERIWDELGYETKVVATGGLAPAMIPNCKHDVIIDSDMILKGLKIIYEKNK